MKSIDEIKQIPNLRLYMPNKDYGIAKIKLKTTTHIFKARIVFSCHSGMDMVMIMFKKNKRATPEEIAEVKEMFFAPEEIPSTNGPAMGLRKKVWSRNPDRDNAPPRTAAVSSLGRRIFQMML